MAGRAGVGFATVPTTTLILPPFLPGGEIERGATASGGEGEVRKGERERQLRV
ncbi:FAD-binding oxidoreductase [Sesbania bispinosa]|nr:FAD-binding oxidoreductase [Sesbania bispinosa]